MHWLHPIFKKGFVFDPNKYRGVHFTPIVYKICERVLGMILCSFFENTDCYGASQWAFRKGRSHTDLVALLINTWLIALETVNKVGVYLSDIAGAFDRVDSELLFSRLQSAGVSSKF